MFALGAMYSGGHNISVGRTAAESWFRAASESGHGQAQLMLGRYLRSGVAGHRDLQQARFWLESAFAQSSAELGELTPLEA